MRYVVTLSSIPSRFDRLGDTVTRLLRQSVPAEAVIVYIPQTYRRFPDWDGTLPEVPEGVEIRRVDKDFGPATKVLHAVREFAGTDMEILFCDDDMRVPLRWAERFLQERAERPDDCIAAMGWEVPDRSLAGLLPRAERNPVTWDIGYHLRWLWRDVVRRFGHERGFLGRCQFRKSGYVDIFEGFSGVMVRADFFPDAVFDIPRVLWAVDDVWLSGMAVAAGHPAWAMAYARQPSAGVGTGQDALMHAVIEGAGREEANQAALDYMRGRFGIWR